MSRIKISEYKDREIILIDFSGCGKAEIESAIEEVKGLVQSKKSLYVMANVTSVKFTSDVISAFQAFAAKYRTNIKAMAVLGLSGLEKMAFKLAAKSFGTPIEVFSVSENRKAVDWLVSF